MPQVDRDHVSIVRYLAVLAAGAMMLALLPLAGTATAQDEVEEPADACPEDPPESPYEDRDEIPEVHVRNVDCITHRDIAEGFADNTYRPALQVRRDQMTSFIARTVEEAGFTLPAPTEHGGFEDTEGNTHEDRIRQLAAAGIVEGGPEELEATHFGPARLVRRDQMASFLIRAAEFAFDQELGEDDQRFTDVPPGNVHFENINAAHEYGLTLGGPGPLPDTQYGPALSTRRDQMASFLARLLGFLENPPDEIRVDPENLELDPQAATNPVGTEHTVTASVTGADGAAIVPQVDVRFEVYRGATVDGETVTLGDPVEDDTATTTGGTAEFAYTGPDDSATDVIVACVVDDPANDVCEFTAAGDNGDVVITFDDGQVGDSATKAWVPGVAPTVLTLDPATDINPVGTEHTVTATLAGADQAPIVPQVAVRFDVYRDAEITDGAVGDPDETGTETTSAGEASFTYTGPDDPAEDLIVACVVDDDVETCQIAATPDGEDIAIEFQDDQVGGTASKFWVPADDDVAPELLTLDPAAATNEVATEHTVTAAVTGVDGAAIDPQVDVRFEVYRDATIDGETVTLGDPVEDDTQTTTAGSAEFTYTGPADPAQDLIVACVVDDPTTDVCEFTPAVDNGDIVGEFDDGQVGGTATKTWSPVGAPTTLTLDPAVATNPVDTDHTVTATVESVDGAAIDPQVDVRFEVYRDATVDGETVTLGDPVEEDAVTTTAGTAEFTYTGPADPAQDLIVACVVDDPATDVCEFTPAVDNGEIVGEFDEGQVGGTATKTWSPVGAPTTLTLDPAVATNPVDTDHTVTATVESFDGAAIDPQVDVRFEVYRDADLDTPVEDGTQTTTAGSAEFTYTGPADPAQDLIVACVVDDPATDVCEFTPALDGVDFEGDQVGGTATKTWEPAILP